MTPRAAYFVLPILLACHPTPAHEMAARQASDRISSFSWPHTLDTPAELADEERHCIESGGSWHSTLLSCRCPERQAFFTGAGCQTFRLDPERPDGLCGTERESLDVLVVPASTGASPLSIGGPAFSFLVDCKTWTASQRESVRHDAFNSVSRHFSFPSTDALCRGSWMLSPDPPLAPQVLGDYCYGRGVFQNMDPTVLLEEAESARKRTELFETLDPDIQTFLAALKSNTMPRFSSYFEPQMDCRFGCQVNSLFSASSPGLRAFLAVIMTNKVPTERFLSVYQSNGHSTALRLTGDGTAFDVETWKASQEVDDSGHTNFYTWAHEHRSGSGFVYRDSAGKNDKSLLDTAMLRASQRRKRDKFEEKIVGAMMEHFVNVEAESVMSRFGLDSLAPPFPIAMFSFPEDQRKESSAASFFSFVNFRRFQHGTYTAASMLKHTRHTSLRLLDYTEINRHDPAEVAKRWRDSIERENVRVVNISVGPSLREMPNEMCLDIFRYLYDGLPDVFFVVASGNTSGPASGLCPDSLLLSRDNGVSVAGGSPDGSSIVGSSNIGATIVDVAAPNRDANLMVVRDGVAEAIDYVGTSHAAAWVSNKVLRLLETHPDLTPEEIKARLYASCDQDQRLDVKCGGSIREDVFLESTGRGL